MTLITCLYFPALHKQESHDTAKGVLNCLYIEMFLIPLTGYSYDERVTLEEKKSKKKTMSFQSSHQSLQQWTWNILRILCLCFEVLKKSPSKNQQYCSQIDFFLFHFNMIQCTLVRHQPFFSFGMFFFLLTTLLRNINTLEVQFY